MNFSTMLKHPSAYAPIAMSLAALAAVLAHIVISGTAPQQDEGAAAHLWQLLMATQIPIIIYFAIRWLPHRPQSALAILALQMIAAVAALAPVYLLNW